MPKASLLLREPSDTITLSAAVDKSRYQSLAATYELRLSPLQLDFVPCSVEEPFGKASSDEGFESDTDSLSLVSSEGSFQEAQKLPQETDSANGSASSDSDTDTPTHKKETYPLTDCMCYTATRCHDLLIFIIRQDTLVFRITDPEQLQHFYTTFNTLKAIANQKTYGKTLRSRFNLLQRTDKNGVTHTEITKEPSGATYESKSERDSKILGVGGSPGLESRSAEDILDALHLNDSNLRKVWKSTENVLEEKRPPERPERRRKPKGRAPPPPIKQDVLHGQYVRVNIPSIPSKAQEKIHRGFLTLAPPKPFQQFRYVEKPSVPADDTWTYSVPRFFRKPPRSQSETRFIPMAYRYIDTTQTISRTKPEPQQPLTKSNVSNRLFGMSSKLKDFSAMGGGASVTCPDNWEGRDDVVLRRSSLGELSYKVNQAGSLKSVIKKEEGRRPKEKKVTFSAYTTVQVV